LFVCIQQFFHVLGCSFERVGNTRKDEIMI